MAVAMKKGENRNDFVTEHWHQQAKEIQRFGDVAIIWTSYLVETEENGKRVVSSGRATEIFVRRNGEWVNPGWHTDSFK